MPKMATHSRHFACYAKPPSISPLVLQELPSFTFAAKLLPIALPNASQLLIFVFIFHEFFHGANCEIKNARENCHGAND